ncbi:MAG: hypothetical protein D6769_01620 [Methanobacteriota archaeon]|nr:MAG: hypothetical protein D6769_01620 [Euryarchaeota archaeon]
MLLSGEDIKEEIRKGSLRIEPYDSSLVGPDSIDIRLGNKLLVAKNIHNVVDVRQRRASSSKVCCLILCSTALLMLQRPR